MRVKDTLKINMIISVFMMIVLIAVLVVSVIRVSHGLKRLEITNHIINSILERNLFRNDYIRDSNERARLQWLAMSRHLNDCLTSANRSFPSAEDQVIVHKLLEEQKTYDNLSNDIIKNRTSNQTRDRSTHIENRLITQLDVKVYSMMLDAQQLQDIARASLISTFRLTGWVILIIVVIVTISIALISMYMIKTIGNSIELLKRGAANIGNGHLDYAIRLIGNDEFVDLSNSFNTMMTNLRESYSNLEKEILERKKTENALYVSENELRKTNENLEELVHQRTEQVRLLSTALTLAEQRERKRISYILHENLQQKLLGIRLLLGQHLRDHDSTGSESRDYDDITDSVALLDKAINTAQSLSIELNPPILNSQGLDSSLQWLIQYMKKGYGLDATLHIRGDLSSVRNETQLMITQIVRELLYNVIRHSGVNRAEVDAGYQDKLLEIKVVDKGKGFNPDGALKRSSDETRLSLYSIKERLGLFGGELIIDSSIGHGTTCTIVFPVEIKVKEHAS